MKPFKCRGTIGSQQEDFSAYDNDAGWTLEGETQKIRERMAAHEPTRATYERLIAAGYSDQSAIACLYTVNIRARTHQIVEHIEAPEELINEWLDALPLSNAEPSDEDDSDDDLDDLFEPEFEEDPSEARYFPVKPDLGGDRGREILNMEMLKVAAERIANHPPSTAAFERMLSEGISRFDARRFIANVVSREIDWTYKHKRKLPEGLDMRWLSQLPDLPDEG